MALAGEVVRLKWSISGGAIRFAQRGHVGVFVSPITTWEIGTLAATGRIQLNRSPEVWFESLLGLPDIRLAPLSSAVPISSCAPPRDPANRLIVATACPFGYTIVTRDGERLPYARAGYVAVVAC